MDGKLLPLPLPLDASLFLDKLLADLFEVFDEGVYGFCCFILDLRVVGVGLLEEPLLLLLVVVALSILSPISMPCFNISCMALCSSLLLRRFNGKQNFLWKSSGEISCLSDDCFDEKDLLSSLD